MSDISLDDVLNEHGAMLSRIASSYVRDGIRHDDLLQDISIGVWQALPTWRGDASLRVFLARVAHNRALDHLARQDRKALEPLRDDLIDDNGGPIEHAQSQQRRLALLDAIRQLPLASRQAVVLALEGFSQHEIGIALGADENAIAQRLSRARRQLRKWMGERL